MADQKCQDSDLRSVILAEISIFKRLYKRLEFLKAPRVADLNINDIVQSLDNSSNVGMMSLRTELLKRLATMKEIIVKATAETKDGLSLSQSFSNREAREFWIVNVGTQKTSLSELSRAMQDELFSSHFFTKLTGWESIVSLLIVGRIASEEQTVSVNDFDLFYTRFGPFQVIIQTTSDVCNPTSPVSFQPWFSPSTRENCQESYVRYSRKAAVFVWEYFKDGKKQQTYIDHGVHERGYHLRNGEMCYQTVSQLLREQSWDVDGCAPDQIIAADWSHKFHRTETSYKDKKELKPDVTICVICRENKRSVVYILWPFDLLPILCQESAEDGSQMPLLPK